MNASHDVFISYRRQHGSELAQLIRSALTARGYRVFLDVRDLSSGHFDTALLQQIKQCTDFILLLTPGSLDRCKQEDDWLRKEITEAMKLKKNIVPVITAGFDFPGLHELPEQLSELSRYQCSKYDHLFSDESISRLSSMLKSEAALPGRSFRTRAILAIILFITAISGWYFFSLLDSPETKRNTNSVLPIALYWHGFGQRFENDRWREFIVQDGSTLYSGDQFRLVFSPSEDCYAYVIALNADGTTSVLFPNEAIQTENRVRAGESYEIPDGLNWFTLDESTGSETIYLVASYDRLKNVEQYMEVKPATKPDANIHYVRLQEEMSRLQNTQSDRTREGKIILRGIKIESDRRTASAVLSSGKRVQRVMQFEKGGSNVVKRIRIYHQAPTGPELK